MNYLFRDWLESKTPLNEAEAEILSEGRHSIEVGFRSEMPEIMENFIKLVLGYVGAAMKQLDGCNVKYVFSEKPLRVLVSNRNWTDGEWIAVASFNEKLNCFIISKGFYRKDRNTVSIQHNKRCVGDSASEIAKELKDEIQKLEKENPAPKLNSIKLKRGPKR